MMRLILAILTASVISTSVGVSTLEAQTLTGRTFTQAGRVKINPDALRELLVKGLKVTREDEKEYVNAVVAKAVKRELSLSMIYASFRYARTRRPQYPFPYFVYSLETLQKRQQQNR